MIRFLLPLAFATFLSADRAEACSCVPRTFAQHAQQEKRVLVVRAGKPVATGKAVLQQFTVLATLKGPAAPTFTLDRRAQSPCDASYQEGALAILFTTGGDLSPCSGNELLASQLGDFASIVKATGAKRDPAKLEAIERALREVLPKYLHARPAISIRHAPLAGTSFDLDKSKLTFAKAAAPKDIEIVDAFATGNVVFVAGKYATEGLRFQVLLHLEGTTWKILHASAVET
jgi:hypothetical protein